MNREHLNSINLSSTLSRVLAGENPENIFGVPVMPYLYESDFYTVFLTNDDSVKDPHKKAIVETIRAGGTLTVASHLEKVPSTIPLPPLKTTMNPFVVDLLVRRIQDLFDYIKPISWEMVGNPDPDSIFERTVAALGGYIAADLPKVRSGTAALIAVQEMSRSLLPAYLRLVMDVYERDHSTIGFSKDLDFKVFSDMADNSRNIVLRTAHDTVGHHIAYGNVVKRGIAEDNVVEFLPEHFELGTLNNQPHVKLKLSSLQEVRSEYLTHYYNHRYDILRTGCPANVELSLDGLHEVPKANLINTLLNRALY